MTRLRSRPISAAKLLTVSVFLFGVALQDSEAQEIKLHPGDTLHVQVDGLPGTDLTAEISYDGLVRLGWFGSFIAEGKTLSEVLVELQASAEGRVFKRYSGEGVLSLIKPRPEDIFLDVAAYRPVTIGGDVVQPGEVPYRANMTLRSLMAISGGPQVGLTIDAALIDPVQLIRLQSDYNAAVLDTAQARLTFWRLSAELDEDFEAKLPSSESLGVSQSVAAEMVSEQQLLLATAKQTLTNQRDFLARAFEQAVARVSILKEQQEKLEESLKTDEAEEARIQELLESGLAMASRSSDARRATILSATRLLDVESDLARADLDVTRLSRDKDEFEQSRIRELSTRRDAARNDQLALQLRLEGFRQLLSSQNIEGGLGSVEAEPDVAYTVYRRIDGAVVGQSIDMDAPLFPGDIVQVSIIPLAPTGFD